MPRPVHFEIHSSDPKTAIKFYGYLFGWTFQRYAPMEYWLVNTGEGEGINGGLMKRLGGGPVDGAAVNAYVVTIGVPSCKDYFEKAKKLGAVVALDLHAIPDVGWQAYVKDPDGNIVGLHESDSSAK